MLREREKASGKEKEGQVEVEGRRLMAVKKSGRRKRERV